MRSEVRRVATALVETKTERFATHHPRVESERRLAAAIETRKPRLSIIEVTWADGVEGLRAEVQSRPAPSIRRFLMASSFVFTMLIVSSAWTILSAAEPAAIKFLVPLVTVLGILAFPLVVVGLGSQREAEEASLRRAIRHALLDEAEFPRPLRDED